MLQINPFLDCTVYSGIGVHIGRNSQFIPVNPKLPLKPQCSSEALKINKVSYITQVASYCLK